MKVCLTDGLCRGEHILHRLVELMDGVEKHILCRFDLFVKL